MSDKFIETEKESFQVLQMIHRAGRQGGIGDSKLLKGYRFWNATGSETAVDFPNIYWKEELEKELLKKLGK